MMEELQAFFRQHPKLVPVDDFEVAVQKTRGEKRFYLEGSLSCNTQEEHIWIQLKLKHRNRPGVATATVFHQDSLEELVGAALENAEKSHPNSWFRFPVWSSLSQKAADQPVLGLETATESCWTDLEIKTRSFKEEYEVKKIEAEIFRRSEKVRRAAAHKTVFHSWELGSVKDTGWGIINRKERLKRLERRAELLESKTEAKPKLTGYFSFAPPAAAELISQIGKWFLPQQIQSPGSPLSFDRLGEPVFSSELNLIDDGNEVCGPLSLPFDLEGVRTQRTKLVDRGCFSAPLYDAYFSAMNNCKSTGNAFLPSESSAELEVVPRGLCVISGTKTESEIWGRLNSGISIEFFTAVKLAGPQDLTVDGWGWEIEEGKKQRPIVFRNQPLNMLSLMNQLTEVSRESEVFGAVKTPTLFFRNAK